MKKIIPALLTMVFLFVGSALCKDEKPPEGTPVSYCEDCKMYFTCKAIYHNMRTMKVDKIGKEKNDTKKENEWSYPSICPICNKNTITVNLPAGASVNVIKQKYHPYGSPENPCSQYNSQYNYREKQKDIEKRRLEKEDESKRHPMGW